MAPPGIEPGPPEDTKTMSYLSLKIKAKNPGNFVTPTADRIEIHGRDFLKLLSVYKCDINDKKTWPECSKKYILQSALGKEFSKIH